MRYALIAEVFIVIIASTTATATAAGQESLVCLFCCLCGSANEETGGLGSTLFLQGG